MIQAEPAGRGSKSRKVTRSSKKVAKTSGSRNAKKARGSSKASRASAGKSRRGRASSRRELHARGRGRRGKQRWRQQVASRPATYTRSGIHNFLTQSWANAQGEPERSEQLLPPSQAASVGREAGVPAAANRSLAVIAPYPAAADLVSGTQATQPGEEPFSLNPLVNAYADSLFARGYDPTNQGFIVETVNGEVLAEYNADRPFNPASVIKVATSLVAISKLGPDFRFRTSLYTDGGLDQSTGTLRGNLYVIGSGDPAFFFENALLVADQLNRAGIRSIEGNLIVLGQFYFNLSASREASAKSFRNTLSPETWSTGVNSAYPRFLSMRTMEDKGTTLSNGLARVAAGGLAVPPSLKISGETITDQVVNTSNLKLLAVHTSLPLVRVLKGLNDFSNNWMATVIGNLVGGPLAVQHFLRTEVGLKDEELNIVTSSGLGSNFISPRGTIQILRKLNAYLEKGGLGLNDMLPVAGIDAGTLQRRFTDGYRGAVVGKTGTLNGVSALAGMAYTRTKGPLLFVIYNRGGSVPRFRAAQDETIKKLITFYGGPAPIRYFPEGPPRVTQRAQEGTPTLASPK
ncbi:MAG TPA: D-alanyl-D-alanine carboxypeptidase [Blastocatellia bacterium]|nr:D-alanyl-D-alanine carboxypeptidase [Blastocatellia bacterium]